MRTLFAIMMLLTAMATTVIAQDGPRYSHTGPTLLTGIRVIDGLGGEPKENQDIVLIDGKIASMGPAGTLDAPKDALVIKGKGLTAMPGLIDMHVHLQGGWANGTIRGDRYQPRYDDKSVQQTLSAHLYAGVTSVLDCGSDHEYVLKWRKRINDGAVLGPRFFTTGAPWDQEPSGWEAGNTTGDNSFGGSVKVTALALVPEQMDRYKKDKIEIIKLYAGHPQRQARLPARQASRS
jgi:imidazolonepropionase-like amidohydrolase